MKKHFLLLIITTLCFTACSPILFMQIATLSSDNVALQNDGSYIYKDTLMTIEYDFWTETGKFHFTIMNNSDDDIYLNLAESYFVNNGNAYDYYQARTYIYTNVKLTSTSLSISTYDAGNLATTYRGLNAKQYALSVSKGSQLSNSHSTASEKGISVEYMEKPIVCIPAYTSKTFVEFNVASAVYRECGFIRDPRRDEQAIREYSTTSSPRIIENRLTFELGDMVIPVTNVFYVTCFQNISYYDATEYIQIENCDGTKKKALISNVSAKNKFYITYSDTDLRNPSGNANDRVSNKNVSFGNSSQQRFYDDVYGR